MRDYDEDEPQELTPMKGSSVIARPADRDARVERYERSYAETGLIDWVQS